MFAPLGVLPLSVAEKIAFLCFIALTGASVYWWADKPSPRYWILTTLLTAATFPFFSALYCLQPTLLIAALLAASHSAARSGRFIQCGILLALAESKPQLALPVTISLVFWAVSDLRNRKGLIFSFVGSSCVLMALSQLLSPGWFLEWIRVLQNYRQYTVATPLLAIVVGKQMAGLFSVAILCTILFAAWAWREGLPFTIAYSVTAFLLIIPCHPYDEVLLLAPITWLIFNRSRFDSWSSRLLIAAVTIALRGGWVTTTFVALLNFVSQRAAHVVWACPLGLVGVVPWALFIALFHYAFIGRYRRLLQVTAAH